MSLASILTIELFDYYGIDFMGSFPDYDGYQYILVAWIMSKRVEAAT